MSSVGITFFIVNALALLLLPRRWAPVPLLVSCCYMTLGQGITIGPFSLPVYRMVLAVGFLRVLTRGERFTGKPNTIDKLLVAWAIWVFIASLFHKWEPGSGPVYASGFIFNITLVYFLVRIWCRNLIEVMELIRVVAFLLVPVALEMAGENATGKNMFSLLGGISENVFFRNGDFRAQGPFAHAILAGTVGSVCFPLMVGIWHRHRYAAVIGGCACLGMVVTSASSGPLMSLFFGIFGLLTWRYREWLRAARFAALGAYLALELVMNRPAYYMISEIDLTGSSTGWHRSRLIEMTIAHFSEWWRFGTDRTVHWMGLSVDSAGQHSDITNYYIYFAVIGGLPALLLLIAMLWRAFGWVGAIVRESSAELGADTFMVWCFGSGMFAHAATSLSAAYFDQSMIFFWLNVAVISSMYSIVSVASRAEQPLLRGSPAARFASRRGVPKAAAWIHQVEPGTTPTRVPLRTIGGTPPVSVRAGRRT